MSPRPISRRTKRRMLLAGVAALALGATLVSVIPPSNAAAAPAYSYGEALQKSLFFYEAQSRRQEARLEPGLLARRLRA